MSRAEAIKYLKKQMPKAIPVAGEAPPPIEFLSSGSVAVNYVSGGGFPRGKISEVFGVESSGKTTLCLTACARAQDAGLYPVYVDIERGLDPAFASNIGFNFTDPEKGWYLKPNTAEEVFEIIETMSVDGKADIIVVDSIPAMVTKATLEGKISEIGQLGQIGRLLSSVLPRITKTIEDTKTALVFTNQLRANINTDSYSRGGPQTKTAGGYALKYFSSLRLELKQTKRVAKATTQPNPTDPGETIDLPVASKHSVTAFKNKVSTPYRQTEFYIRYDPFNNLWGIDDLQVLIDIATAKGMIEAKGGGYFLFTVGDPVKVRGEDKLYQWMVEHPDRVAELRKVLQV